MIVFIRIRNHVTELAHSLQLSCALDHVFVHVFGFLWANKPEIPVMIAKRVAELKEELRGEEVSAMVKFPGLW